MQNGSFESYTNIDCTYGGFDNGNSPFNHVVDSWYCYQTPDYFNTICNPFPFGWFNMPNNYFGGNNSKAGNSYVGLGVYEKNGLGKEYIYQQLTQPLEFGKIYCLSFYVNRADRFTYAIKNIGALLSNNLQPLTNGYEINTTPQVENQFGVISDTTNWTQIQGCFTAIGGEQYITIGNFTTNFNTDTLNTNSTNLVPGREATSYYYIDDITLIEQSTVGVSKLNNENSFEVYPNPANTICTISSKTIIQKTELTNIAGQILLSVIVNEKTHQLQLNNFSQGIYFVKVYYSDGLSVTKKVIVNP